MAFDLSNFANQPRYKSGMGIASDMGVTIPNGDVVAYVRSGGVVDGMHEDVRTLLVTTLNAGLARCRAGQGDIVVVLPGHAENVSAADQMSNLVAGTRILGMGEGSNRPKLTWTVAAATFLLDVADVTIDNFVLQMAASGNAGVTVAAPITVSAATCAITNCRINFGDDANDIVTIGITTTAAANGFTFANNECIAATAGATGTTFLQIVGGDALKVVGNYISGASSAVGVGLVRVLTTATTNIQILDNVIRNNLASSEEALTLLAACTGFMNGNNLHVLDNASTALDEDGSIIYGNDNYLANTVSERGVQLGTVSA